jgi:hypothetical protein
MGLLRYQLFLAYAGVFLASWFYALRNEFDLSGREFLIDFAPLWAVLCLGAYAALRLAIGLVQFKSYPNAAMELELEVAEAKAELKKRGII